MSAMNVIQTGEVVVTQTAAKLPSISGNLFKLKALSDNANSIFIGGSTVTVPQENTNITTGFELAPGEESGWLPISLLSNLYAISETAGDQLVYLCLN